MFEDAKEPIDIFAEVDKAKPAGQAAPGGAALQVPAPAVSAVGPSRILIVIAAMVVVGLVGGGIYFFMSRETAPKTEAPAAETPAPEQPAAPQPQPEQPAAPQPEPEQPAPQPQPEAPVLPPEPATAPPDADGDGLPDSEEYELGSDPQSPDTDSDQLSDREEVRIYKTDPTKPDTDGDSYLDGEEVKAGYNPNGPGKLFELPN